MAGIGATALIRNLEPRGSLSGAYRTMPMPLRQGRECPFRTLRHLRDPVADNQRPKGDLSVAFTSPLATPTSAMPVAVHRCDPETSLGRTGAVECTREQDDHMLRFKTALQGGKTKGDIRGAPPRNDGEFWNATRAGFEGSRFEAIILGITTSPKNLAIFPGAPAA